MCLAFYLQAWDYADQVRVGRWTPAPYELNDSVTFLGGEAGAEHTLARVAAVLVDRGILDQTYFEVVVGQLKPALLRPAFSPISGANIPGVLRTAV